MPPDPCAMLTKVSALPWRPKRLNASVPDFVHPSCGGVPRSFNFWSPALPINVEAFASATYWMHIEGKKLLF